MKALFPRTVTGHRYYLEQRGGVFLTTTRTTTSLLASSASFLRRRGPPAPLLPSSHNNHTSRYYSVAFCSSVPQKKNATATTTLDRIRTSFWKGSQPYFKRSQSMAATAASTVAAHETTTSLSLPPLPSPIYVAATRQHVGKTSTSLALLSGLQKRFEKVGFMKPVGQQSLKVQTAAGQEILIDKDAVLVKEYFALEHLDYQYTSPILIPPGYTRNYLDGKIKLEAQEELVQHAYREICQTSHVVLCEGTGHCAVGSIVHASNAQVASWLNAKMVLVANGGLGSCFDELQLNKTLCDVEGVEIAGVIVNKVQPDKVEQTQEYIQKALDLHWGGTPLLGCIPDRPFLGCPALTDLERLFGTKLLTGSEHRLRHYQIQDLNLVATSQAVFLETLRHNPSRTLYVAHSSRTEILLGFLEHHPTNEQQQQGGGGAHQAALVVTGTDEHPLCPKVAEQLKSMSPDEAAAAPPVILAPFSTHKAMDMIHRYTPKLNFEDAHRANKAIEHYEPHIDFDLLLERAGYPTTLSQAAHQE